MNGRNYEIKNKYKVVVNYYSGSGGSKEGAVMKCDVCKGTGVQVKRLMIGPGMMQQIQSVCQSCRGQGEMIDPEFLCKVCSGNKVVNDKKILEVHVDPGM